MDLKTLEYMEERTKKARGIVEEIKVLKSNIMKLERVRTIRFLDERYESVFNASTVQITNELKAAYVQVAENHIDYLEKQLAEL